MLRRCLGMERKEERRKEEGWRRGEQADMRVDATWTRRFRSGDGRQGVVTGAGPDSVAVHLARVIDTTVPPPLLLHTHFSRSAVAL